MSWQAYIDRLTASKVAMAGIYGKNGAPWANTPNFNPSPDEIKNVVQAICSNDTNIFTTGVRLSGNEWTVIRLEAEVDMLILKGKGADNCKHNLIIAASNQALIMGANVDENVSAGVVRIAVEGIRDYLKSNQF